MKQHPARLIAKKRDGGELSAEEIRDLIGGVVDGSLGDAQLGAWLMAVCCRGMTAAETAALTLAMRDSGRVLRHDHVTRPKIDKHSTGGVGDKVSLLLAPLVAAAGVAHIIVTGMLDATLYHMEHLIYLIIALAICASAVTSGRPEEPGFELIPRVLSASVRDFVL